MSATSLQSKSRKLTEADKQPLKSELIGLGLIAFSLCLFLALVSFSRAEGASETTAVNLIGPVGVYLADATLHTIGLCSFFLDAILLFCGFSLLTGRRLRPSSMEIGGYALAVPSGAVFMDLIFENQRYLGHKSGGFLGELGAEIGRSLIGSTGTGILIVSMLIISIALISETNPSVLSARFFTSCRRIFSYFIASSSSFFSRLWSLSVENLKTLISQRRHAQTTDEMEKSEPELIIGDLSMELEPDIPIHMDALSPVDLSTTTEITENNSEKETRGATIKNSVQDTPEATKAEPQFNLELDNRAESGTYLLPSASLLSAPKVAQKTVDEAVLKARAQDLEQALLEFKIRGAVSGITPGPLVTMYEFEPAPGVKLSSIANLTNDLARVIKAQSVRIVAPIPGKGVVGIEVPNESRETVFLREVLGDPSFTDTKAKLPLALGKDIAGKSVVTDLARMPHLLVAGSTGSGKSVAINTMVMSLLYQATPEEVKMIMVDPKMLELSVYDGIPHLLVPVVTDPGQASAALKWAVDEMERRYHLLSDMKVRNIGSYNQKIDRILESGDFEDTPPEKMPFIVIIIDEFSDLMMVASKDVEICVTRLAQKARAAGVHLILATQRPSVDVITGLIKANFPTRISFRVFSQIDSRTVLDVPGAETLLGMGDMLFRPPGRGDLVRVHGAYVDEKEIEETVQFLKSQGEPDYQEEILVDQSAQSDDFDDEVDEMYDMAVQLVTTSRKASISMVQRKLRVGYNRAARMIEMMEREAIVGKSDGRGGRDVLAPPPPPVS